MLNSRFCAPSPNLENSEVVIINKLESVFCAQFEFRTQTEVNQSQTQRIGDYLKLLEFKKMISSSSMDR